MTKQQEKIFKSLKEFKFHKVVWNSVEVKNGNFYYPISPSDYIQLKNVNLSNGIYNLKALQQGLEAENKEFVPLCMEEIINDLGNEEFSLILDANVKKFILEALKYVCRDDRRYHLNGIHFGNGYISATDGRRAILKKMDILQDVNFILNWNSINSTIIKKLFTNSDNLKLTVYKEKAKLENDEFLYIFNLLDGQFPNVKQIIPDKSDLENEFLLPDLKTLKSIKSLIGKNKKVIFYDLNIEFTDKNKEVLQIPFKSSLNYPIAVDIQYILDAAEFTHYLQNSDNKKPLVKFNYNDGGDEILLIMPMQ